MAKSKFQNVKLPEVALEFLQIISASYPQKTEEAYRIALKRFYLFLEGQGISLIDFTHRYTDKLIQSMVAEGLCAKSRSKDLVLIRGYLRWLQDQSAVPFVAEEIIQKWDFPKIPMTLPRALSPEVDQILQLRLEQSGHYYGLGFLLMRWTGVRIGELRSLPYNCILIHIDGQAYLKVPLGKFQSERLVPLTPAAVEVIQKIQTKSAAVSREWRQCDPIHLLVSACTDPVSTDQLHQHFKRYLRDLPGGEKIVPHQLRHTFATTLLNAGMSLPSIMKLLGHRTTTMTLVYARVSPETLRKEYFKALETMRSHFPLIEDLSISSEPIPFQPEKALIDLSKWILKWVDTKDPQSQHQGYLLLKRIQKLKEDVLSLAPRPASDF